MTDQGRHVWTVGELAEAIKQQLQTTFPDVQVRGEVSGLATPGSGHMYFTFKDDQAAIRCIVYRHVRRYLRLEVEDGKEYLVRGKISSYGPRSEYQVLVDYLEPLGLGALHAAFLELQQKLAANGFFDQARKRPLPKLPERVGIVTSLHGAALRDMLRIIFGRRPGQQVVVSPTQVQGETAAQSIAHAIEILANFGDPDVIIVGRGGGSLEDLWCWNEEPVVRAVVDCPVPVISGVGHEVDVSLCDLAADVRAATPTHAAEIAVPDAVELQVKIDALWERARRAVVGDITVRRHQAEKIGQRLRQEAVPTALLGRRLDDLLALLMDVTQDRLIANGHRLALLERRLTGASPRNQLFQRRARLEGLAARLGASFVANVERHTQERRRCRDRNRQLAHRARQAMQNRLRSDRQQLVGWRSRLVSVSPLAVLERGYAIVTDTNGSVLKEAAGTATGAELGVRLHRGRLRVSVTDSED
ncbi:MAG: exodeoxyribonuclease VII large subunit [Candidatus Lernaella stagnicola]|nr:exodeoxyribonuclease VII large subunit [Candidatus Lernaella stagnicola]